jgi:hypothetical protein
MSPFHGRSLFTIYVTHSTWCNLRPIQLNFIFKNLFTTFLSINICIIPTKFSKYWYSIWGTNLWCVINSFVCFNTHSIVIIEKTIFWWKEAKKKNFIYRSHWYVEESHAVLWHTQNSTEWEKIFLEGTIESYYIYDINITDTKEEEIHDVE